jgi:RNA polymerase sigma-70 factor (ECF subfamily)
MYRIVTNTCLDMLKGRSRRVLPQDVGPSTAPGPPTTAPRSDILWLEPYPDALLPAVPGPEQAVRLREGIRLAFVRVVQVLPPRQRAALILHDVLDWSVAEVAGILESTEAAINSALQRGRAAIASRHAESSTSSALAPDQAEVVERFVQAWESGDFDDFVTLLATDAVMSMPPWEYWLDGKDAVVATMRSRGTWDGEPGPGRYRIVPAPMNGEPGGLAYVRAPDGRYHAVCLTVLSLDAGGRVVELTTFVLPELFAAWGFTRRNSRRFRRVRRLLTHPGAARTARSLQRSTAMRYTLQMTGSARKLLDEVLALPEAERLEMASEIIASVDGPRDGDWDATWLAELDRRADAAKSRGHSASGERG